MFFCMKKLKKAIFALSVAIIPAMTLAGCSKGGVDQAVPSDEKKTASTVSRAVNFSHELDSYEPRKDNYNFYFTYKIVHPWWDAVALGMEEAQRQYLKKGITVTYEYLAPEAASAEDQKERLSQVKKEDYDIVGVDVADEEIISPVLDELVDGYGGLQRGRGFVGTLEDAEDAIVYSVFCSSGSDCGTSRWLRVVDYL